MSFLTGNYLKLKRRFYEAKSTDFTKILKSYKTLLIHPVMEPGREVFSLPAIESVLKHKGAKNVDLIINEKLNFFFKNIPAKKICYKDFSSPFSSNYKELKENLKGKNYDIFVELNRFNKDMLTMFALIPKSKIRICVDGSVENPLFNMVVTTDKLRNETERNDLILKPLGVKVPKKRIKWDKAPGSKKQKGKVGIALQNYRIALRLFSFLKSKNFSPYLFVGEREKLQKVQKKTGNAPLPIYPVEKVYEECSSCEYIITSINPVLSISFLQKKRTLLLLEKNQNFYPSTTHHIELFSLNEATKALLKKTNDFLKVK